jgi:hypothetical protein
MITHSQRIGPSDPLPRKGEQCTKAIGPRARRDCEDDHQVMSAAKLHRHRDWSSVANAT